MLFSWHGRYQKKKYIYIYIRWMGLTPSCAYSIYHVGKTFSVTYALVGNKSVSDWPYSNCMLAPALQLEGGYFWPPVTIICVPAQHRTYSNFRSVGIFHSTYNWFFGPTLYNIKNQISPTCPQEKLLGQIDVSQPECVWACAFGEKGGQWLSHN